MACFAELVSRLERRPDRVTDGPARAVRRVVFDASGVLDEHTVLVLTEGEAPAGPLAGVLALGPAEGDWPAAVFPPETDLVAVGAELEALLWDDVLFQEARGRLLTVFTRRRDLQALTEEAYAILDLPVTIFDLSTAAVAIGGAEKMRRSGFAPARYILEKGYAVGYVPDRQFNEQTRRFAESPEPFVTREFDNEIARLNSRITVGGEFAGHVSVLGCDRPFRWSDHELARLLGDLVGELWEEDEHYYNEPVSKLLRDLWDGVFAENRAVFDERFRLTRVEAADYRALYIRKEGRQRLPMQSLMEQMKNCLPPLWNPRIKYFVRQDQAFGLVAAPEKGGLPELAEHLEGILTGNGCRGGLSRTFRDPWDFRSYCEQARTLCDEGDRRRRLAGFEADYWPLVLAGLSGAGDPASFVREDVLELVAYDRSHGSQLAETFLAYLEYGQNVSRGAKGLFVHRNTMIRRLERICRLTGWDLEALPDTGALLLSLRVALQLEERG